MVFGEIVGATSEKVLGYMEGMAVEGQVATTRARTLSPLPRF